MPDINNIKLNFERTLRDVTISLKEESNTEFQRNTKLPLYALLRLLIGAEGGALARIAHQAGIDVTPAAISQRRAQIPSEVFHDIFERFNVLSDDSETYRGYRVLAVDGTSVNMPRNPNSPCFVCNAGAPDGYCQMHLNPLYDVLNRTYFDAVLQPEPQKDEIGALVEMLRNNDFFTPTLIIADRGYESYNLLAHLIEQESVDFMIRVKQEHSAMREIAKLPFCELDCSIGFTITTTQTNEDKRNKYIFLQVPKKSKESSKTRRARWDFPSPYPMRLRIVRFQLPTGEFETITTSLPQEFSIDDIKYLYHLRWGIETSFRDLKYTVGLVNLHGKRDDFVEQEIYAAMTAFNYASRIVREVVIRQPTNGIYAYKVNFKSAVMFVRELIRNPKMNVETVEKNIVKNLIPIREGRQDERKLKPKGFVGFTYRVSA